MSGLPSVLPSFRFFNRNDAGGTKRVGSGLTDDEGNYEEATQDPVLTTATLTTPGQWPIHLKNHKTEGLRRMILRGERLQKILSPFLDQLTEVELTLFDLLLNRDIDHAEGVQLDGLGAIVGEARNGRADAAYRLAIRVRRLVNRSDGKIGQIYKIVNLAIGSTLSRIYQHYPASIGLHIDQELTPHDPDDFAALVREAKAAGVGMSITYLNSSEALSFEFASTTPVASDDQGWGSTADANLGGELASAR